MKVRVAAPGELAALQAADPEYAALAPPELRASGDRLELVADVDGALAGAIVAHVAGSRLRVDYLVTAAGHGGRGYAARLAEAAEAWGRERGATVAEIWTDRAVPFWKGRMAYADGAVHLRKAL